MKKNFIWLFGENVGCTANNNSFYFWKQSVSKKDDIDKYFVMSKNQNNLSVYNCVLLSSISHIFFIFFVSL